MPATADGDDDGLLADLARWAAARRVADSATSRSAERELSELSAAEATWTGVLVDLAEQGAEVALTLCDGSRLAGRLVGVGRDFCHLGGDGRRPLLLAAQAISAVGPGPHAAASATGRPGSAGPSGNRGPARDLSFAAALQALAAERSPVSVLLAGGPKVNGDLVAVGADLLTLRTPAPARHPVSVRLAAVVACELT